MYELGTQTSSPGLQHAVGLASPVISMGGTGVHLFFVLSGFLLFLPYARAALGISRFPSTGRFMIRRALRILPVYWASLIVFTIVAALFAAPYGPLDITLHFLLLHNWTPDLLHSINGPAWTLALESQFYLTIPLFGWIVLQLLRARRARTLAILGIALSLVGTFMGLVGIFVHRYVPALGAHLSLLDMLGFLPTFAAGMAAALLYVASSRNPGSTISRPFRRFCRIAGAAGVVIWLIHTACIAANISVARWDYFFFALTAGVAYAGILLGTLAGWTSWRWLLSSVPFRFVGGISYSVYLWHYPIYHYAIVPFAVHHAAGFSQWLLVIFGTLVIIFPLGWLSYLLFERPFIKIRQAKQ
jgi:peptidoglycan/LPS O-acetylase OafA/YrhL